MDVSAEPSAITRRYRSPSWRSAGYWLASAAAWKER
jgi:hypothetical protein